MKFLRAALALLGVALLAWLVVPSPAQAASPSKARHVAAGRSASRTTLASDSRRAAEPRAEACDVEERQERPADEPVLLASFRKQANPQGRAPDGHAPPSDSHRCISLPARQ